MLENLAPRLPVRLRRPVDSLKAVISGLPIDQLAGLATSPTDLWQMVRMQASFFSFRFLLAVLMARQHRVFATLAAGPLDIEDLARRCGIHREAANTLSRVLESQGLASVDGGRVELSAFSRRYLGDEGPASLVPVVDLLLSYAQSFEEFAGSLESGATPETLDVQTDGQTTDALLSAVNAHLAHASRELFERADLPEIRTFIVGSMGVSFSAELMRRHASSRVTYGCLAHLVERIPALRGRYGVDPDRVDGMHCHTGEPSGDTWGEESYDLVFLTRKMILEPDARVGHKFAAKALEVLEPGGAAVFWEAVHPDQGPSPLALALETMLDLGMSPSAPLKTETTFERTLREIGFRRVDFVDCLGGSTTFAIAHK